MSNTPILDLPVAIGLTGAEWVPVVQGTGSGAVTKRAQTGLFDFSGGSSGSTQAANTVDAGPTSGAAAVPTFRTLVSADLTGGSGGTAGYLLGTTGTGTSAAVWQGFANTASGASTRTWNSKASDWVHVKDFGAVGNGSTDDATAINNAIAAAYAQYARGVLFDELEYAIASLITLGNGSASAFSTLNGLTLMGGGAPFLRLKDGTTSLRATGTRFKWTGSSGGTMVKIAGPCFGNTLQNIALNGNDLAAKCLYVLSASRSVFPSVTCSNFTGTGVDINVVSAESISAVTEGISSANLEFHNLEVVGTASATCISVDGYTGSASNGFDTVRAAFYDTFLGVSLASGTGIRLAYTDQDNFHNTHMYTFGVADGLAASVRIVGTATVPSGYAFPQNIRFTGDVDPGQNLPTVVTGTPGPGIDLGLWTSLDQQVLPSTTVDQYLEYQTFENGNFPTGGFFADGGQQVLDRGYRNFYRNSNFRRATAGATITNPTSGQALLDGWFLAYDGTMTCTVTQQTFTPGQTSVPYFPRNFMRIVISARGGGPTFTYLGQGLTGGVYIGSGRNVTQSAWLKADATRAVNTLLNQGFGSGGSSDVNTASSTGSQNLTTSWAKYRWLTAAPSVSGKTVGGGDSVIPYFVLPNTTLTIDIALPSWELGIIATATDQRPYWSDEPAYWTNPINVQALAALTLSAGSLLVASSATALTQLADGGAGTVLTGTGTTPAYSATPTVSALTLTRQSGTGLSLTFSGAGEQTLSGPASQWRWLDSTGGNNNYLFTDTGNMTIYRGSLTIGTQQTGTQGALVLANTAAGAFSTTLKSSNSASAAWTMTLPTTAGSNLQFLQTNGSGVTAWAAASSVGAALTKTDDTNVTLTLGGAPTTALLTAASVTAGWTGTLSVARGGTASGSAGIGAFNNITGYSAAGATGTTSTNLVFSASPTFTGTPVLSTATATSINGLTITTSTGTLTIQNGITLNSGGTGGTLGTAAFVNTGTSGGTVPLLNAANTFSGQTTLALTSSFATPLVVQSTNDDAVAGPNLAIYRNSASPANSDAIGQVYFQGRNNAAGFPIYAAFAATILSATNGAENGQLVFQTIQSGSPQAVITLATGVQVGAPTGGDKGVGTANFAGDIYKNNTAYTNPDYVLEHAYTGRIVRFADRDGAARYRGRLDLDALRDYTASHLRLPGISDDPMGMFARGDLALEKIEELTLHVLDLHDRVKSLETHQET